MLARLISLLALAALALQGAAVPVMAGTGDHAFDHVWCGKAAPSAEAEAALLAVLEAAGKAPEPASGEHDAACKFCCSAFFAPAALIPATAGAVLAPEAVAGRWAMVPAASPPVWRGVQNPARGPPAV